MLTSWPAGQQYCRAGGDSSRVQGFRAGLPAPVPGGVGPTLTGKTTHILRWQQLGRPVKICNYLLTSAGPAAGQGTKPSCPRPPARVCPPLPPARVCPPLPPGPLPARIVPLRPASAIGTPPSLIPPSYVPNGRRLPPRRISISAPPAPPVPGTRRLRDGRPPRRGQTSRKDSTRPAGMRFIAAALGWRS